MDKQSIYARIADELTQGELAFPTSARVALRVRQVLDDPDCAIEEAARLVQAEPVLAARVVSMANSVAFNRSGREITDVRAAVLRVGFAAVRALATALVTRQLAGGASAQGNGPLATQLWEHTAHVASLARAIARHVTHADLEAAMFAGIVHEVGGFYLLSRATEFPGLLDGDGSDWITGGEATIGHAVLSLLGVPAAVQEAVACYWDGFLEMPPRTLGDTLLLADELAPIPSPLREPVKPDAPGMKSSIELAIGEETLTSILAEAAEEVESLTKALKF